MTSFLIDSTMRTEDEAKHFTKVLSKVEGTWQEEVTETWSPPPEHNAPVYSPEEFRAQADTGVPKGIRELPLG